MCGGAGDVGGGTSALRCGGSCGRGVAVGRRGGEERTRKKNAKGMCDKLIVGVTVDELVQYKGKNAMIPFEDRIEIVRSCKYVDAAVPQYDMDKLKACKELGASYLFVGDDWYGTEKWKKYEEDFAKEGIKIIYFPYTKGISSTRITEALRHVRKDDLRDVK